MITILLLLFPLTANAHSGLSSTTPAEGETLSESPDEIRFQFDTPIQQGDMTIIDESGSAVTFSDITFSDMELIGQLDTELPNGSYIVNWSAISQDGHEVTGALAFSVAVEEVEEEATEEAVEEDTIATGTTEDAEETAAAEQAESATASAEQPAQTGISLMTIIIIAVLAIAAIAFFVMARRK